MKPSKSDPTFTPEEAAAFLKCSEKFLAIARVPEILDTRQAAEFLGVSTQWLELMRVKGGGPKFTRFGPRLVRYRRTTLLEFLARHEVANTSAEPANE